MAKGDFMNSFTHYDSLPPMRPITDARIREIKAEIRRDRDLWPAQAFHQFDFWVVGALKMMAKSAGQSLLVMCAAVPAGFLLAPKSTAQVLFEAWNTMPGTLQEWVQFAQGAQAIIIMVFVIATAINLMMWTGTETNSPWRKEFIARMRQEHREMDEVL